MEGSWAPAQKQLKHVCVFLELGMKPARSSCSCRFIFQTGEKGKSLKGETLPWCCSKRLEALSTPFIPLDFPQPHLFLFCGAIREGGWRGWGDLEQVGLGDHLGGTMCWKPALLIWSLTANWICLLLFISLFQNSQALGQTDCLWLNTLSLLWTLLLSFRSFIGCPELLQDLRWVQHRSGQALPLLSLFCYNSPALACPHPLENQSQWQRCDKHRTLMSPL